MKEQVFVIAKIVSDNKLAGLRLLKTDFETKKQVDKKISELLGKEFFNAEVTKDGELRGVAREEGSYAVVKDGKKRPSVENYPTLQITDKKAYKIINDTYVILCRTTQGKETGFAIADASGKVKYMTEKEAIKLVNAEGGKSAIANGTLTKEGIIKNTVGYYYEVEKIGIIDEQGGKMWDLSDDTKTVKEHVNVILENRPTKNKIKSAQGIKVLEYLLKENDKTLITKLTKAVATNNIEELKSLTVNFCKKYKRILDNCENETELKNALQGMVDEMKNNKEFLTEVKQEIKNKVKYEDCFKA